MRTLASAASFLALFLVSTSGKAQFANVDACSLVTQSEAGTAIGATAQPGQHLVATSKGECVWSDDPSQGLSRRRVVVSIMAQPAFDRMKSSPTIKTERETAVPDEAYYVMPKGGDPLLIAHRKGAYVMIKILNGFKVRPPLSPDEIKKRLLVLGQDASGRV